MAPVEIRGELDFVDGDEIHREVAGHGLDGGDPVARVARLDLLLACDERHSPHARLLDDLVIDLARQQPQGQADDAAGILQHALDGDVGLAGIGRPQHGRHAPATLRRVQGGRRESEIHAWRPLRLIACNTPLVCPIWHSSSSLRSHFERDGNESRPNRRLCASLDLFTARSGMNEPQHS